MATSLKPTYLIVIDSKFCSTARQRWYLAGNDANGVVESICASSSRMLPFSTRRTDHCCAVSSALRLSLCQSAAVAMGYTRQDVEEAAAGLLGDDTRGHTLWAFPVLADVT